MTRMLKLFINLMHLSYANSFLIINQDLEVIWINISFLIHNEQNNKSLLIRLFLRIKLLGNLLSLKLFLNNFYKEKFRDNNEIVPYI